MHDAGDIVSSGNDVKHTGEERIGYVTQAGWEQLLDQVNQQIEEMEALPLPEVKDKVFALLEGVDAIHREGLSRLVSLFKEGVLEQVIADPPIHTLMELYDLLPEEAQEEEQQFDASGFPIIPISVLAAAKKAPPPAPSKIPHWVPVPKGEGELSPNSTRVVDIDGHSILLCRVDNEFFAMALFCEQDGSSLAQATLSRYTLTCPNHQGCYYDVRQGTRMASHGSIECYPVEVAENDKSHIMIGIDMDFVPNLPVM